MADLWAIGGAAALQKYAPTAAAALRGLVALWPELLTAQQLGTLRAVTAEGVGLAPLPMPPLAPRGPDDVPEIAVMAFAEQFAVDVTRIDASMRSAWSASLGAASFDGALAVYVADYVPRVRRILDELFGAGPWVDPELVSTRQSRDVLDSFTQEVALLDTLDPVTTELIRLRGARQHGCRVCMARRSLAAVREGADSAMFARIDRHRGSGLDLEQQAALALTDTIIWTPADPGAADLDLVREQLQPAQALEVVLDVMRNAANKIAVALGADAPENGDVQLFEIDAGGRLSFQ